MKFLSSYCLCILTATAAAQLVALPYGIRSKSQSQSQPLPQPQPQKPLMDPVGPALPPDPTEPNKQPQQQPQQPPPPQGGVLISDVMGRDRSINIFAGLTRDVASISWRLDSSGQNSTVLAPLNSAVERLPRKPWEDPKDYEAFGADVYEGGDGQDRAHRNLQRFVEAHVVPASPWEEREKVKSLLDGDREIWWEMRDNGVKMILPDEIEVQSVASRVGNGEVWIIKGVRNYA
ncbi:hypothetical protein F4778DRAFT_282307 [Xylariomycetidae sp. FL2044]|nr:hypothetical protein F4778DRAFT_282307 [Xylariomycetidae sp. FL2044]